MTLSLTDPQQEVASLVRWGREIEARIDELRRGFVSGQGVLTQLSPDALQGAQRAADTIDQHGFVQPQFVVPVDGAATPNPKPLSADGTHTVINIAAFTLTFPFGTRSYQSGSIDPGSFGTYYVYVVDPLYNGGLQAFRATTSNTVLTGKPGILYLGTITTASNGGTGISGKGGGSGPCFSGNTLIRTGRGNIPFEQLVVGDLVLSRVGWRKVLKVFCHDYSGPVQNMGRLELVTPEHHILRKGEWVPAKDVFSNTVLFTGPVYNATVADEPSYTLVNGVIAHNLIKGDLP